ncbi:MAG: N-acetyl-gamma-glutamyl-phosphate reductase [Thermoleophilia bacterium]
MRTAAIVGAAGYTGQETLDRLLAHPGLEVLALGSDSSPGKHPSALDPRLGRGAGRALPTLVPNAEALASGADVVFLCQGHEEAARTTPPATGVVVDLSGGHRLKDPAQYATWYGWEHPDPASLADWCYALAELRPPTGRLIANPGCYATAILLALAPLRDAIDPASVVVDAKSGMTGAGRSLKASSHAGAVLENFSPYRVGTHQHQAEIEQLLGFPICFVPHLLPVRRGIVATCYAVAHDGADLRALLERAYADCPAVDVLPEGVAPELSRVQHTDMTEVNVFTDRATGRAIVIAALDNLGKGAAGQAVQNANLALGLPPTDGLRLEGVLV